MLAYFNFQLVNRLHIFKSSLGILSIVGFTRKTSQLSITNCCKARLCRLVHGSLVKINQAASSVFITWHQRGGVLESGLSPALNCYKLNV